MSTSTRWRNPLGIRNGRENLPEVGQRVAILRGGAELWFATYKGKTNLGKGFFMSHWRDDMNNMIGAHEVAYWMPLEEIENAFPIPIEGLNA